jgi:hypothetical protein
MPGDVDVIEGLLRAEESKNLIETTAAVLAQLPEGPSDDEVAAVLQGTPWEVYDPAIVWDMSATGVGGVFRGLGELSRWWRTWTSMFTSHVYQVQKYQATGPDEEWVLSGSTVDATTAGEHEGNGPLFQLWKVRHGKVTEMRAFLAERDALRAAA